MLSFENDYNRGAHPEILRRFLETNMDMEVGYGNDSFCESAREKIRRACGCPDADVFFISGGTQTNAIVIDAMLAKYEGVVSAQTGHIHVHESGAVEFDIRPVFDYWAGDERGGASGQVFAATIRTLGPLPKSEMAEVRAFDEIPPNVTYPAITPEIFASVEEF